MEYTQVYKIILGIIRIISAFLARSVMTILAASINPILLFYVMLSLSINQYKYWRNLAYLVISKSVMGYRFLSLSKIPIRYNNY